MKMAVTKAELIQTLAVFKELLDEDNAAKFVAQEDGKGLSTNDFTNALKEKLDEITDEEVSREDIQNLFNKGGDSSGN